MIPEQLILLQASMCVKDPDLQLALKELRLAGAHNVRCGVEAGAGELRGLQLAWVYYKPTEMGHELGITEEGDFIVLRYYFTNGSGYPREGPWVVEGEFASALELYLQKIQEKL